MKYLVSKKQIDKLITPFFEFKFRNCELKHEYERDYYGLVDKDDIWLVATRYSNQLTWAYDGFLYESADDLFGIKKKDFESALKRYMKKKYGIKMVRII